MSDLRISVSIAEPCPHCREPRSVEANLRRGRCTPELPERCVDEARCKAELVAFVRAEVARVPTTRGVAGPEVDLAALAGKLAPA